MYKDTFPQIVGNYSVSNKTGIGIDDLRLKIAEFASRLPLMGEPWPGNWLLVEQALTGRSEHHINLEQYQDLCSKLGVSKDIANGPLGDLLHDLGKILYFRDDDILSDLIVLKPNWVTKAISHVLTDEFTRDEMKGVLLHSELNRIWKHSDDGIPYQRRLFPIFLRLMERFDLSYQIQPVGATKEVISSLVPQLLSHQPPFNVPPWPGNPESATLQNSNAWVEMIYRINFIPAGIMSWFIVRTHRYSSLERHWRDGVLLEYKNHFGRVELNSIKQEIRLAVWGPQPHNLFTIVKDTLDHILDRFEGLNIQRRVPCVCHWKNDDPIPCEHFYRYEQLIDRLTAGKKQVECYVSLREVSVQALLFGIHEALKNKCWKN
jgi:internalin A